MNSSWEAVEFFENLIADYAGSKYAVSVDNCTNAMFMSLKYLNAEGTIFPCSWTSFPYKSLEHNGKVINWEDSFFTKYKKLFNIKGNRTLEEILNDDLWTKLFDSFAKNNWVECGQKCSREVVDKKYGVGYYTN